MNIKIPISKGITEDDLLRLRAHTIGKINSYIKNNPNKFRTIDELCNGAKIAKAFFEENHVCMNCGDVQEKGTYAIAQNAMGHKIIYTCDCGHKTTLPQS